MPDLLGSLIGFLTDTWTIAELEVRRIRHEPIELLSRAVQPALWLLVFGQVFTRAQAIPTGGLPYTAFLTPGILAQSVLFIAIFYGIAIIWERDLGITNKLLASPVPREALVLGKALSAGLRGLVQAVIIYVLAALLGVALNLYPLNLLGVVLVILLGATVFSTFSLIIASVVKSREAFMGIGQVLTFPLFFVSNAIFPVALMPTWLQVLSRFNPLSYQVDALRALMLAGGTSLYGLWLDLAILLALAVALVLAGARLYPRVVI